MEGKMTKIKGLLAYLNVERVAAIDRVKANDFVGLLEVISAMNKTTRCMLEVIERQEA